MTKLKFIKNCLWYLSITISILLSLQYLFDYQMQNVKTGSVGKINKIIQNNVNEEITIWGASTAEGNFIPKIIKKKTGLSAFNMGIDGTNIQQYGGLLEYYLNEVSNKKVIISLDIHGGLMNRQAPYQIYNWLHTFNINQISTYFSQIDKMQSYKIQYVPFYKLLLYGKHNVKYFKERLENFKFDEDGYIPRFGELIKAEKKVKKIEFANDSIIFSYLKNLSNLATENNNEVFVILTPCYKDGLVIGTNTKDIINQLQSLTKKYIHFLDFSNHEINLTEENFKDNTHLNHNGAILFSEIIGDTIQKIIR